MKKFTIYNLQFTIKLVLFLFSLYIVHFTFYISPVFAVDEINQSAIHPASPLYFLKGFKEVLELKFAKTSQDKGLKHLELATRRIREVKSLINVNRADLIPPALEKYWLSLGMVSGLVNINNEILGPYLIDEIGKHIVALVQIQNQTDNQRAQIAIRALMYRISFWNNVFFKNLNAEGKNKLLPKITVNQSIICNFLSKEASSSALNQTEKFVLQERAKKCLQINK